MSTKNSTFTKAMQPWPTLVDFSKQQYLPDQGLNLFYFQAGSHQEQNLLMIHGLGDESDTWRHVFLPLAENYNTLAVDLPGFGRSEKPDIHYTPQFMMDVLSQLLDKLQINSTILMGSSLGGILAHGISLTHPNLLKGLILVGGALLQSEPINYWQLRLMQVPVLGEWLYTRLRKDPDAAFSSLTNVYYQLHNLPEADREFLFNRVNQRVWSDEQRRAYFSTLRNLTPWIKTQQRNLPDQLRQLDVPTLVMRGEHDQLFSDHDANEIIQFQPNAEKFVIPNVGHLPHQEDPEHFLQITCSWLNAIR